MSLKVKTVTSEDRHNTVMFNEEFDSIDAAVFSPTVAEIDLDAVRANIFQIQKLIGPRRKIMPIIKSNAYGYGALPVAKALESKADVMGVAFLNEGIELRQGGIRCPILVMDGILDDHMKTALQYGLTITVFNFLMASALSRTACLENTVAKIHIEIDTGMGRLGLAWKEALPEIIRICELPNIEVEGVYSHLATAEIKDDAFTFLQIERFRKILDALDRCNIHIPVKHMANSAAILQYPEAWFGLVRPGLMIYGIYPARHLKSILPLRFPLTVKTKIIQIRFFEKGSSISYGRTFICPDRRQIAVMQVGYTDGFSRLLSNRTKVLVKGKPAPLIGAVCMDLCMIDITDIPDVKVGDEVILLGGENGDIMVEKLASLQGTIPYEIISTLGRRVKRVYREEKLFHRGSASSFYSRKGKTGDKQ